MAASSSPSAQSLKLPMEFQAAPGANDKKKAGKPLPKRGQVKARIFGGLVRAVIPKAFKNGGRPKGGGHGSSEDTTPATSGYTSSFDDD